MSKEQAIKFFEKGDVHLKVGEFDQAIEAYTQAIALNPKFAEAFRNRGTSYAKKGEFDRAIQDLDQAIDLDPGFAGAFNNRGLAYYNKGEFDRAIQDFNQAIALDPKDVAAFNNRGLAYEKKGEIDKAIKDFNQAIDLGPKPAEAFRNRGLAYYNKGEFDRAIQDLDQAIELKPNFAIAFYNRGVAYRSIGKEQKAIQDFKDANKLDPTVIPKEQVKKTEEKVTEVQNFQEIFKELRDEYKKGETVWLCASIVMVIVVFGGLLYLIFCLKADYKIVYPLYIFLSVITFIIIRQYTNAKQLRIEASNRLAMAKMFEKIQQTKDNPHYQDFIPKIIESIAYSMRKNQQESITPIDELLKRIKK